MESMSWSFWSPASGSSPDKQPPQKNKEGERGKTRRMKQRWWGRGDLVKFLIPVHQLSVQHGGHDKGDPGTG